MKVALVAMPWPKFDAPSAALGTLGAYLRRERPDVTVKCLNAYVDMWARLERDYESLSNDRVAELLFVPKLYPETSRAVKEHFNKRIKASFFEPLPSRDDENLFARIQSLASENIELVLSQLEEGFDLVGFTVTYCQLFSSLAVAKRLKQKQPSTKIVFGGIGVDFSCGRSLVAEYPFVDFVVQGEGERPLLRLVDAIADNTQDSVSIPGILSNSTASNDQEQPCFNNQDRLGNQITDINSLPLPDYREYEELANEHNIYWHLPIEGSRGCWWNRKLDTDDPKRACYFCNLNAGSYREKTVKRLANEIGQLARQHNNVRLRFLDNGMRKKGLAEMLDALGQLGMDLQLFVEARASIQPYELLLLWEAGCYTVQIGVEGLSTSYLRRIGKGATTIQNLQAMKTCFELELLSSSNLLTHFPGSTPEEVDETVLNIQRYAVAYEPTTLSKFNLYDNTSVYSDPTAFGVSGIRNAEYFSKVLPSGVADRLSLFWLDFDADDNGADWEKVAKAQKQWKALHEDIPVGGTLSRKPLYYTDGGTFLEIVDRRDGFRLIGLDSQWRDVFLYCMEIRSRKKVLQQFSDQYGADKVQEMLDAFVQERLMFTEDNKVLSLAPAVTPLAAARRIRADYQRDNE